MELLEGAHTQLARRSACTTPPVPRREDFLLEGLCPPAKNGHLDFKGG